jgi:hypothetical protein
MNTENLGSIEAANPEEIAGADGPLFEVVGSLNLSVIASELFFSAVLVR